MVNGATQVPGQVRQALAFNGAGLVRVSHQPNQNYGAVQPVSLLAWIKGDLWISNNARLTSLEGLNNLQSIGGGLYIQRNAARSVCIS